MAKIAPPSVMESMPPASTKALASHFASCAKGVLTVVREKSPGKFSVPENVKTQEAPALWRSTKTHQVFVVDSKIRATPPASTLENPHPRHSILPDTSVVLVVSK
jgi:hypothetical protein